MKRDEKPVILFVSLVVPVMSLQAVASALKSIDRAAIMLVPALLFFVFRIRTVHELESIPRNIILLFSGAMSIGFCLWKTAAAQWMAYGSHQFSTGEFFKHGVLMSIILLIVLAGALVALWPLWVCRNW